MPYVAFVCPECENAVDPSKNIFCGNCGTNLSLYESLEKDTFYERQEYCPNCHQPGGWTISAYQHEESHDQATGRSIARSVQYGNCAQCDHQREYNAYPWRFNDDIEARRRAEAARRHDEEVIRQSGEYLTSHY